ncbi:MAG: hypothetical protein DWQ36_10980 [Acidobacteria bacterium]|nr:MAG: hypothetical protein DWQ30_12420 [Acidobacteriota bacterium]REK07734.1 MAG: hypothetical protein DWQ36_10980 [Acidobacteriota bacterium]
MKHARVGARLFTAALISIALVATLPASSLAQQQADDLRYRTGLESLLAGRQLIVRVTELDPRAAPARVTVVFRDDTGRVVARDVGVVSPTRPFETILDAGQIGSDPRELVRIDLRISNRSEEGEPVVNVDVYDPNGFANEGGWSCNGRNASAGGPIGNCVGIIDFVPAQ